MEGARLQSLLYKGYAKAAKHVGFSYDIYRWTDPTTPIAAENKIGSLNVALATRTRPFEVPQQYQEAVWLLFADGRKIRQRDYLVGQYGTFYVADMQPNLPIQGVRCNHSITINRIIPGGGGLPVLVAANIPVYMILKRIDIKTPQFATSTAGQAITHWTAFIPLPEGMLKQHDIVIDEHGVEYILDAPDFTHLGYVASIRLAQP